MRRRRCFNHNQTASFSEKHLSSTQHRNLGQLSYFSPLIMLNPRAVKAESKIGIIRVSKGLELFEHEANARMGLIFMANKIVLLSLLCFFLTAGVMFIPQITNNTESPGAKSFPGSKLRTWTLMGPWGPLDAQNRKCKTGSYLLCTRRGWKEPDIGANVKE